MHAAGWLTSLPSEICLLILERVVATDVHTAHRVRQACSELRGLLDGKVLGSVMRTRRLQQLRWVSQLPSTRHFNVMDTGKRLVHRAGNEWRMAWSVGSLLPPTGVSTWKLRVEHSYQQRGDMIFGVCSASGDNAWGLGTLSGKFFNVRRSGESIDLSGPSAVGVLDGYADGAFIELQWDADARVLSVVVACEGPLVLPAIETDRAEMRIWVRLTNQNDCVLLA